MQLLLIALGLIPLALGGALDWIILDTAFALPYSFVIVGVVFLLFWGVMGFILRPHAKSAKEVVLLLNLVAILDLVLVVIQNLVFGHYWLNMIGRWSQLFYLPMLMWGNLFAAGYGFAPYCISCAFMIAASAIGCVLNKKRAL